MTAMSPAQALPLVKQFRELAEVHHELLGDIHVELSQAADIIAELYETLQGLVDIVDETIDSGLVGVSDYTANEAVRMARAALAKARGEQQP